MLKRNKKHLDTADTENKVTVSTDETVETLAAENATADDSEASKSTDESVGKAKKSKSISEIVGICLPLVIICVAVALMLSAVNMLTADIIAANAAAEKRNAVLAIFPEATDAQLYKSEDDTEIYLALRDSELIGCSVSLSENGFGGKIALMVGKTTEGDICGVQIVTMSETPGIGTQTKSDAFLSQFKGSTADTDFDAISGATISSRAIIRAVNRTLDISVDFTAIATEKGLTVAAVAPTADTILAVVDSAIPLSDTPDFDYEETVDISLLSPVESANTENIIFVVEGETVYTVETEEPEEIPDPDGKGEILDTLPADSDIPADSDVSAETTGEAETTAIDTPPELPDDTALPVESTDETAEPAESTDESATPTEPTDDPEAPAESTDETTSAETDVSDAA